MNIIAIIIIFSLLNAFTSIDINYSKYKMKIYGLKVLVFKKKNAPKIFKTFKNYCNICYYKTIVSLADGINDYNNNFTDDQKFIIETLISLCY